MNTTVLKLYSSFKQGHFLEVFIGEGDNFIRDYTMGVHDTMLVFYHLFDWLKDENKDENKLLEIKYSLKKIISTDKRINKYDGGLESLGLLISYCIGAKGEDYWPIEKQYIAELLELIPFKEKDWKKYNIERDVNRIKEYLGLYNVG